MTPQGHQERPDEDLVALFAAGDRSALGELARRYERSLLGLAAGLLGGDRTAAMDAVQETWVRVIRGASGFRGRASFKTWVYRIAINRCTDMRSRRLRDRAVLNGQRHSAGSEDGGSPREGFAHPMADSEEFAAVRDAVERLSDKQRLVILLCYHRGMTHEQAAEILQIPIGTLKSRLNAALAALRITLGAEVTT